MQFMPLVDSNLNWSKNCIITIIYSSIFIFFSIMGRPPCCDKLNVKRGLWTREEDAKMLAYISTHGIGNWTLVPKKAGLNRCGKSCRLRWTNYLRPDLKHDNFTPQEEQLIINLHQVVGSRWSLIAKWLPRRTDNDVKNYWNTKLRKKLQKMGIDPVTHKPFSQIFSDYGNISTSILSNTKPTLNDSHLISKREPPSSSVLIRPSTSNFILNPNIGQTKDISFNSKNPWGLLPQFEITQPHLFNETISSSCSSSSSTTFTQLNSPKSYSCQQSQTPISASSACLWNELLLNDAVVSTDFQQQELYMGKLGSYECAATSNFIDQTFSSAASFVDLILDKDKEMCSQFPQQLDPSFDY